MFQKFKITKEKTVKALQEYIKATVKKKQMIKNTSTECSEEYVAAIKERNQLFKKTGNMSRQKVRMLAKKSARELENKQKRRQAQETKYKNKKTINL